MKVVLAGATGYIGRPLTSLLHESGHQVLVLTRDTSQGGGLAPGVETAQWDGRTASGSWTDALEGADAIVNLSGANIGARRWTEDRKGELRRSRQQPAAAIVEALGALPAERRPRGAGGGQRDRLLRRPGGRGGDRGVASRRLVPGPPVRAMGGGASGRRATRPAGGADAHRGRPGARRRGGEAPGPPLPSSSSGAPSAAGGSGSPGSTWTTSWASTAWRWRTRRRRGRSTP